MTTLQALTSLWQWEPSVLLGSACLLWAYVVAVHPNPARTSCFAAGIVVMVVALVSPLDALGDRYLFSAHMLQHLLLILVVPPLLLLGLRPSVAPLLDRHQAARSIERVLGHPAVAWTLGVATLWIWHLPALYDAALRHEGLHILQHLSFLATSTAFWWPALDPADRRRLPHLFAVLYLAAAGAASSVLGIILTFAPPGIYPFYTHPTGSAEVLALIRTHWGLSAGADQQLGGLLMWLLGTPIYLLAVIGILARWYSEPDMDTWLAL